MSDAIASCLIGLGANLGNRQQSLAEAVELLRSAPGVNLAAVSRGYATTPIGGPTGQGPFLNAAVRIETVLSPDEVHALLTRIEADFGRQRTVRWAPRTLDLDLLLYDEIVLDTPHLSVPHPRMAFRRFVLEPAAEVAGQMVHPRIGWTVAELLAHLNSARPYVALAGLPGCGKGPLAAKLAERLGAQRISDPIDAPLLAKLMADLPSRDSAAEIELLRRRASLPSAMLAADKGLAISDFWFDQSLAFAKVNLRQTAQRQVLAAWEAARTEVIRPKLLIVLDPPLVVAGHGQLAQSADSRTALRMRRALRKSILGLADRRGIGPVLLIRSSDPAEQFVEALAAVESMN